MDEDDSEPFTELLWVTDYSTKDYYCFSFLFWASWNKNSLTGCSLLRFLDLLEISGWNEHIGSNYLSYDTDTRVYFMEMQWSLSTTLVFPYLSRANFSVFNDSFGASYNFKTSSVAFFSRATSYLS